MSHSGAGSPRTNATESSVSQEPRRRVKRRRRVPYVEQLTATECGTACLAMVLQYFGSGTQLADIRAAVGAGRDGSNANVLLDVAHSFGLRGYGARVEMEELDCLEPGAILHWNFSHYVVFERLRRGGVDIVDPAAGRSWISRKAFGERFTGVALLLEPSETFQPRQAGGQSSWRFAKRILADRRVWTRVLAASVLLQVLALAVPLLTRALVDRVIPDRDASLLTALWAGFACFVGFQLLISLLRGRLLLHLRIRIDRDLTIGLLERLIDLPYSFFAVRPVGDLLMRMNSTAIVREIVTSGAISGVLDVGMVSIYLGLLVTADRVMALTVAGLGALHVVVFLLARRRQQELQAESIQRESETESFQVEMMSATENLKAMGAELVAAEFLTKLYVKALNVFLDRGRLQTLVDSTLTALSTASPLVVLGVGALRVLNGQLSLGEMLELSAIAGGFLWPLSRLVGTADQLQYLRIYTNRLNDIFDAEPEQDRATARSAHSVTGAITLSGVSFSYSPNSPAVVRNVSLAVEPGQYVAIVGASGAGKSTLANLMLGLYKPTSGVVRYDEHDLQALDLRALRKQIGVVPQFPVLFAQSIRDNIALADPTADLSAIVEAARVSQIHDEIVAMPLGYDTPLTDRGASLSGGQRQRLALARALVRKPQILLLDEATSSLDALNEALIHRSLTELACTRIVIAHRMSTIMHAHLIVVMEGGRLAEMGSHQDLLGRSGVYASLVRGQRETPGPIERGAPATDEPPNAVTLKPRSALP